MGKIKLEVAQIDFLKNKKDKGIEDFKTFINEFFPKDRKWFAELCLTTITTKSGRVKTISDSEIKKQFYERYFSKDNKDLSKRVSLLGDWLK